MLGLTLEQIVSGIVGLLLAGGILKRILEGYVEARKTQKTQDPVMNAHLSAVTMQWSIDQQTLIVQTLERIADALETQAKAQISMSDQQRNDMNKQIEMLLKRLGEMELPVRVVERTHQKRRS